MVGQLGTCELRQRAARLGQVQSFVSVETVPWSTHSMPRAISQSSLSSMLLPPGIGLRRVPSVLLNSR